MGLGAAVCVVVVLGAILATRKGTNRSQEPTATVTRGSLPITVCETGELEAERRKIISNELTWSVIIKELVDEGTVVQEGETIVQFECKELLDAIASEELQVTSALNNYTQAEQNVVLKKKEMDNALVKAQRKLTEAEENRVRYVDHEHPIELAEKESALQIADQQLKLAQEKLDFKERVNKMPDLESPFSMNEIEADKLEVQQRENAVKKASLAMEKFKKYDHRRSLRELDEGIADAKLGLERAELELTNQVLIAESNELAKKRTYEMRKKKLDELLENEKKLTVKAEQSGLVVYDTARRRWNPNNVVVATGEQIRPRQQIMVIPDMSTLQITTKVYEAVIEQVKPGLPALIRLDAKPDSIMTGKVEKVAPLPNSQNRWLNPGVKVFNVTVTFDEDENLEGLKPGMTAEVELILAELKDVLTVPLAAVFTEQEKTFCYHVGGASIKVVPVKLGRMNSKRVEIVSGLDEGDKVLLAPPSDQEALTMDEQPAGDAPVAVQGKGREGKKQ